MNILVATNIFSHYRLPLLRVLSQDNDIDYTFLAGLKIEHSIRTIEIDNIQLESFHLKLVNNIQLFNSKFFWQQGLISECLSKKYDGIIFLGNPYYLSTWVAIILSRNIKKVFFWTHGIIRNQLRDRIKLVFFRLAHGLLLYGEGAKQRLINYGFDPENIFVIYNSLDYVTQEKCKEKINTEIILKKRKELFLYPNNPILLFIGRLSAEKKLDYLVCACAQLHQRIMPVNVLFIGDGTEKDKLNRLVLEKNLQDFFVFYGECYDEEKLSSLIAMSDLCVSPGNVGLTAVHALNYGTPVITHNNPLMQMPEYEAIEPGITGMLYEYESIDSLVNSIYYWLSNNQNNREEIRTKCYEVIKKYYNPDFQASTIKSAICQIMGKS